MKTANDPFTNTFVKLLGGEEKALEALETMVAEMRRKARSAAALKKVEFYEQRIRADRAALEKRLASA